VPPFRDSPVFRESMRMFAGLPEGILPSFRDSLVSRRGRSSGPGGSKPGLRQRQERPHVPVPRVRGSLRATREQSGCAVPRLSSLHGMPCPASRDAGKPDLVRLASWAPVSCNAGDIVCRFAGTRPELFSHGGFPFPGTTVADSSGWVSAFAGRIRS